MLLFTHRQCHGYSQQDPTINLFTFPIYKKGEA